MDRRRADESAGHGEGDHQEVRGGLTLHRADVPKAASRPLAPPFMSNVRQHLAMATDQRNSPLRDLMADADGVEYRGFGSLLEAKQAPDGIVVLEGDDGGQIYVVARAAMVRCSEETLLQLLRDIDAREWPGNPSDMAHLCYEAKPLGAPIAGGMGGGQVAESPWVHPRLKPLEAGITAVLSGKRERLVE
jgi:hypothetical protein